MGWLEVLALLKRIAPLLGRLAPMLETILATRTGGRNDTDTLERISGDIKGQLAATGEQHSGLVETLSAQAAQLAHLAREAEQMRASELAAALQLQAIEASLSKLKRLLMAAGVTLILLVLLCVGLLAFLVVHHPA